MNHKKLYRLYREEKLLVRRRAGRKRALGTRAPIEFPRTINQRWSLDFVSDTLADGRRFRVLYILDDSSRECLAPCRVRSFTKRSPLVRELDHNSLEPVRPDVIVSDNGTELSNIAVLRWATDRAGRHHIQPGKPAGLHPNLPALIGSVWPTPRLDAAVLHASFAVLLGATKFVWP